MALLVLMLATAAAGADPVKFAILHPDLDSAPGTVFQQVLTGIGRYPSAEMAMQGFGDNPNAAALSKWANTQNPASVILLGNQSLKIARQGSWSVPVVVGGVLRPPVGMTGVSILGEPSQFFSQLKSLAPGIKTVSIIYSPDINDWWVKPAIDAAKKLQLTLRPLAAADVVTSARLYRDFLDGAKPGEDALWIPLHDITPMKTVLPLILRESWSRNIVVFSNNPLLVKQGVLFAMYPDNEAMGHQIAKLASRARAETPGRVVYASQLHTALNRRTAAHLGINVSEPMLQQFDRIYPVQ
jgi:putative ABC transport system substrate-binding protein